MIPVHIKDAGGKSLCDLTREINELKNRIEKTDTDELFMKVIERDTLENLKKLHLSAVTRFVPLIGCRIALHGRRTNGGLRPDSIDPDGIIVSNAGSVMKGMSGSFGLLEIVEPKMLAVGIGAVEDKVTVKPGEPGGIGVEKQIRFCIAFDHRALDFGDIVPFIAALNDITGHYAEYLT
jgi:2-oxoacid dehydrogenases acyltransferase (catalytic domain).